MTLSVALVGFGAWGKNLARVLSGSKRVKLGAIIDSDSSIRAEATDSYPGVAVHCRLSDVLVNANVDAVVISTPTSTHAELARQALEARKHVFCEKALAPTAEEAREITALAERSGVVLMVGHIFLFNSSLSVLKHVLDSGELGDVRYMTALRTNLGPVREDVNALVDLAVHDISVMNHLLDELPAEVSAVGKNFLRDGIEDVCFLTLHYPSGAMANIHVSWMNPRKERRFTIVGTQQMAVWEDGELESPIAIYRKKAEAKATAGEYGVFLQVALSTGGVWMPPVDHVEPLKQEIETFVDLVYGATERNISGGEMATGVAMTLEAAQQSMLKRGAPVALR